MAHVQMYVYRQLRSYDTPGLSHSTNQEMEEFFLIPLLRPHLFLIPSVSADEGILKLH